MLILDSLQGVNRSFKLPDWEICWKINAFLSEKEKSDCFSVCN